MVLDLFLSSPGGATSLRYFSCLSYLIRMMVRRRLLVPLTAALLAPSLALVPSSSRPSTSRFRAVHPSRPRHTLRHSLSLPPLRAIKDNDDIIDADFQSVSAKEGGADKKAAPVEATPVKVTPVEVVGSNEVSSGGGGAAGAAADAKEEEPAWRSIFPKGPEKEPEPPMPTDPALRAIAQDFGMRRTIASNWIWLSVILDMKVSERVSDTFLRFFVPSWSRRRVA